MPICTNQMAYRESKHRSSIKAAKHKYKRRSEVLGQVSSVKLTQEQQKVLLFSPSVTYVQRSGLTKETDINKNKDKTIFDFQPNTKKFYIIHPCDPILLLTKKRKKEKKTKLKGRAKQCSYKRENCLPQIRFRYITGSYKKNYVFSKLVSRFEEFSAI